MQKHKALLIVFLLSLATMTKSMEPAERQCAICLDPLSSRLALQSLYCHKTHQFHQSCIHPWLKRSPYCPICRSSQRNPLRFGCLGCMISLGYTMKSYSQQGIRLIVEGLKQIEEDLARANDAMAD